MIMLYLSTCMGSHGQVYIMHGSEGVTSNSIRMLVAYKKAIVV